MRARYNAHLKLEPASYARRRLNTGPPAGLQICCLCSAAALRCPTFDPVGRMRNLDVCHWKWFQNGGAYAARPVAIPSPRLALSPPEAKPPSDYCSSALVAPRRRREVDRRKGASPSTTRRLHDRTEPSSSVKIRATETVTPQRSSLRAAPGRDHHTGNETELSGWPLPGVCTV